MTVRQESRLHQKGHGRMTDFRVEQLTCACCSAVFRAEVLQSTNRRGYSDLDGRPPEMQRSTMHYWLQECPTCLYCAYRIETAAAVGRAREIIESDDYLLWTSRRHPTGGAFREVVRDDTKYIMSESELKQPFESFSDKYFQPTKALGGMQMRSKDYRDWLLHGTVQHNFSRFRRLALIGALNGNGRQVLDGILWSAWYADDEDRPWANQPWPQIARQQRKQAVDLIGSPSDDELRAGPPILLLDLMRRAEEWRPAETLAARAAALGTNYTPPAVMKPETATACLEFERALIAARNTACYRVDAAIEYAKSKVIPPVREGLF